MSDNKTAFITGGSGFLGRHIIDLLLDNGWDITSLHRPGSEINHLEGRGIHLVIGDVTDKASVESAMPQGVNAVFHVAANISLWSRNDVQQNQVNIGGTRNMLAVAKSKQVGRFIYTSSIAAFGCQPGLITENTPSVAATAFLNYERTKHAAEQLVRQAVVDGLDAVIMNPSAITGPADTNNWARSFFILRDGSIPGAPTGATSMCDVRDVAQAHVAAFSRGKTGENYLLGGPAVSYKDMIVEIGLIVGKDLNIRTVPGFLMRLYGRWNHLISYITQKEPDITPEIAFMMSQVQECSGTKATEQLGYNHRDWRSSIRDSFDWLVEQGLY